MRMNWYMGISRNMVVVRSGDELTLLNPIRLDDTGEAALAELGRVRHLVRLGGMRGEGPERDQGQAVTMRI